MWKLLREVDVHFRRQAPIGPYIADFVCHHAKLIIEVDGALHDLEEGQLHDAVRTTWLQAHGYRVLRFRNRQVFEETQDVLSAVRSMLTRKP